MNIIILAAGEGKRMKSSIPKVLNKIGGLSMLTRVVETALKLKPSKIIIIVNPLHKEIKKTLNFELNDRPEINSIKFVEQSKPLGTGHAVKMSLPHLNHKFQTMILFGDVPLLSIKTLRSLKNNSKNSALKILTAFLEIPFGYGRIIKNNKNQINKCIEEKDASSEVKKVKEICVGPIFCNTNLLMRWIGLLNNKNKQKEYYLTQIIEIAKKDNVDIRAVRVNDNDEILGANNLKQKLNIERVFQKKQSEILIEKGVEILDSKRFDLRGNLIHKKNVLIDIGCLFIGEVRLGNNVKIGAYCIVKNSIIKDNVIIEPYSYIDESQIGANTVVGPYARLRVGTKIGKNCKIGNFVETKNVNINDLTKANHLTYLGDAEIGKRVNIGAGTITCNYDGNNKNKTIIEDNVFVGSNSELIAPLKIRKGTTIAAGSCITDDTPSNSLTIARNKQTSIENWKRPKTKSKKLNK